MHTLVDRCVATTITTSVGALTLDSAPSVAYINLAEAVTQGQAADGMTIGYVILEGALDNPTAWEIGEGTIGGAGGSLTRGARLSFDGSVYSSSPLQLGPGVKYVVFTPDASGLAHTPWTWCGTAGGTANALTLTPSPPILGRVAGQLFRFRAPGGGANTGPSTIEISGQAAAAVQIDNAALRGGEIQPGRLYEVLDDGTQYQLTRLSFPSLFTGFENLTTGVTSIPFTGIPPNAEEISIVFRALSGSTTGSFLVQVGSGGGGWQTSGYAAVAGFISGGFGNSGLVTNGIPIINGGGGRFFHGDITLRHIGSDKWTGGGRIAETVDISIQMTEGTADLAGPLDRIRLLASTGTIDSNLGINVHYKLRA